MIDEPTVTEAPEEDVRSPGEILALGRELRGLTEEQAAERLNLSVSQIRSLEAGRYSELPGKTYVLGYLKAYARLVDFEESEVLRNFNLQEDATIRGIKPVMKASGGGNKFRKVLGVLVVIAAGGLGLAWWQNSDRSATVAPETGFIQQQGGTGNSFLGQIGFTTETRTVDPAEEESTESAGAAAPEEDLRAMIEAEEQSHADPDSESTGDGRKISLQFDAASWVDLRDVDGERLIYEHISQDRRMTVEGNPPFSIFLGNADGVRIEYEGKPFDFSEFKNGVYARFSLGQRAQ